MSQKVRWWSWDTFQRLTFVPAQASYTNWHSFQCLRPWSLQPGEEVGYSPVQTGQPNLTQAASWAPGSRGPRGPAGGRDGRG